MDYFLELLDSYDQLKKRTLKLTYVSEADNQKVKSDGLTNQEDMDANANKDAETKALEVVRAGVTQPFDDTYKRGGQPPYAYLSQKSNEIQLIGGPMGSRAGKIADAGGNPDVDSDAWKKLLNFFKNSGDDKLQQQQQEEEARLERMGTLGSLVTADPERFPTLGADIVALEQKNLEALEDLCEKGVLGGHFCRGERSTLQYIGGSYGKSIESKLFMGTGVLGFDETGKLQRHQIGEQVFQETFQTNLELLKELGRANPDCDFVNNRIGTVGKSKVVLFSSPTSDESEPQGGIVLDEGGLHAEMLNKFKDCDIQAHQFKGSSNELNNTKGRFNENFTGFITRLYSAVRGIQPGSSPEENKESIRPLIKQFEEDLQRSLTSLQEFAGTTPMSEQGVQLESFPVLSEVENQLGVLQTKGATKNLLQQMYVQLGGLIKRVEADDIIAGGEAQTLGGKVDNFFLYRDDAGLVRAQQRAHHLGLTANDVVSKTPFELYTESSEALKSQIEITLSRQGLSIEDTNTQVHLLGIGNKMSVGSRIKFGDLSLSRAVDIVLGNPITGTSLPKDEEAYYAKLMDSLQVDASEEAAVNAYMSPIQKGFQQCELLSQQARHADAKGDLVLTNPKEIAKTFQDRVLSTFTFGEKGSNFYNACVKQVPNPVGSDPKTIPELVDLADPKNQKRASESLQRDYLSKQFERDYNGDDPIKKAGAINSLCKMAGATIMEQSEFGQIVTEESIDAAPLVLNQNDILRGMGEARKNGSLNIDFRGSTFVFSFKVNGKQVNYSANLERQKDRPAIAGHISKEDASKVGKKVRPISPKRVQDDTMHQYFMGQIKLLESLINQSKDNHLL